MDCVAESSGGGGNGRTWWRGHWERGTESHVRAERRLTSQRQMTVYALLIQVTSHVIATVVHEVTALAMHLIRFASILHKMSMQCLVGIGREPTAEASQFEQISICRTCRIHDSYTNKPTKLIKGG